MSQRITQALNKLFEQHRIVFWYDDKQELRKEFEVLEFDSIEKIVLDNNEFGVKYRILREEPKSKFLIYSESQKPESIDNWLLDVLLANGEFRTDQAALWLSELDLDISFIDLTKNHSEFFKAKTRIHSLRKILSNEDNKVVIRLKMLAACCATEAQLSSILESLLDELAKKEETKLRLIHRCHLDNFLWEQLGKVYGYDSKTLGLEDFAIELFKSCYAMEVGGDVKLNNEALFFLKRWKDSRRHEQTFETLSHTYADVLAIENDLNQKDFQHLLDIDYFRLIDQKIISDLVSQVESRTASVGDISLWIKQRQQSHWYETFKHIYDAIDKASQFFDALNTIDFSIPNLSAGITNYTQSWFKLDQLYRQFIFALQASGQTSLLNSLAEKVENHYSNNYLLKLNNLWQKQVDQCNTWSAPPTMQQGYFFKHKVKSVFLKKKKKVVVIISDAMRYEVGDELVSLIRQEDRYDAQLNSALSTLPSYTQLGMAALLPHQSLRLNNDGTVSIDGTSSQGTANRIKILKNAVGDGATAIKDRQFMEMSRDDGRALLREHELIYIYHNRIDHTGDKLQSEGEAFKAASETLDDLLKLIKKLTAANASNLIITADHGFIYQNRALEESEFIDSAAEGDDICYRDRRFVLGKGLKNHSSLRKFTSKELGLAGDMEIQIPKSINRLRLKGSGSRFVHGGASLQEVVIPIININKKRKSDLSTVDIEVVRGTTSKITSGQILIKLYQTQAVTDKIKGRSLQIALYSLEGTLLSNVQHVDFDFTSENPREREYKLQLILSREADDFNHQDVLLKLEEKRAGTSHYTEYLSLNYQMSRSFSSDFDF